MRSVCSSGWLVLALFLFAPAHGAADEPFVDPYKAASPSGRWVLQVEPTSAPGEGPARYRMTREGAEAWAAQLEFTLRECVVSDSGVAVGYAYDNGYLGWDGKLIVMVVAPDGRVLTTDPHPRDGPQFAVHPPPPGCPRGSGLILDEEGGRAIVRVANSDMQNAPSTWWIYSLTDGTRLAEQQFVPARGGQFGFSYEIDARLVPTTGLVAVHWMVYEDGGFNRHPSS